MPFQGTNQTDTEVVAVTSQRSGHLTTVGLPDHVGDRSTAHVDPSDAFDCWREMISDTFVPLTAEPKAGAPFTGTIQHLAIGEVEMSTVVAGGQRVRRTRRLIAGDREEYILASIQVRGTGRVHQDNMIAPLGPGDVAFYDSTRPYTLHFDDAFEQLVVQVPRTYLLPPEAASSGITARVVPARGLGGVVSDLFQSIARVDAIEPQAARVAMPHCLGLLNAAAAAAAGRPPCHDASLAVARERVVAHLRQHLTDTCLDADRVACAFAISRRTLYRVLGEGGGVAATLRRLRVERAQQLLATDLERPVLSIATACGFKTESAFYRAFKAVTGQTPGEFRYRA